MDFPEKQLSHRKKQNKNYSILLLFSNHEINEIIGDRWMAFSIWSARRKRR